MKYITFLSITDWANVLTNINLCLKTSSKYKSICICYDKHRFKYDNNHEYNLKDLCKRGENHWKEYNYILEHIKKSEFIIMGYQDPNMLKKFFNKYLNLYNLIIKKKIINYHASKKYFLIDKTKINFIVPEFNNYNKKLYIIIPGMPIVLDNNIHEILNKRFQNNKIVITHVNSRNDGGKLKGSLIINKIMNEICVYNKNIQYNYISFNSKTFSEIMEIKKKTDIYIDQYNNDIGGFGTSSIEAMKYGCIILCTINKLNESIFEIIEKKNFPILNISGSVNNFKNILINICSYDKRKILDISKKNIDWINQNLSSLKTCSILEKYFDNIYNEFYC